MSKFSINNTQRSAQSGFTLIELVVVMVILGILAATALPKFANLGSDARIAKLQAARAAMISGAAMYHSRWLAAGSPTTGTLKYDGVTVTDKGYPVFASIKDAAGGLSDYDLTNISTGVVRTDTSHDKCIITYAEDGTVTAPPPSTGTDCD